MEDTQIQIDRITRDLKEIRDSLQFHRHTGYDQTQKISGSSVSTIKLVDNSTLGDGIGKSGNLELKLAAGMGDVSVRAVIDAGDFANAAAKTGFIFGLDDSDSDKVKFYWGSPTAYIKYDGSTVTIVGSLLASSINIPDTTTASSFHVDTSGNAWWGSNIATGISGATASITAAGVATFKNILIGGANIQYQVTNSGIFSFGDGSDGAGVADGVGALAGASLGGSTYTLSRDVYYTDLTVSTGVTINPAGYRIFVTGTLTLNGTAKIARNGNNGGNGSDPTGGTAGAALADGYLKGSLAGTVGGDGASGGGSPSNGGNPASTTNSIGSNAVTGGNGGTGDGGGNAGGTAGAAATATTSNVKLIANWHLATLLDISASGSTVKFDNSPSASGGGGGGRGNGVGGQNAGGGGGGGSSGGIIAIYARVIVIGASASITANGGNGGNGGNATGTNYGGGGGGGGGNGGQVILVYNQLTNSGSITASAGTAGTAGTGNGTGASGSAGTAGTAGTIRQFQVSL